MNGNIPGINRKFVPHVAGLCLLLAYGFPLLAQRPVVLSGLEEVIHAEEKRAVARFSHQKASSLEDDVDVHAVRAFWQIDPARTYISGRVHTYYTPVHSSVERIQFDLVDSMIVDTVLYHGTSLSFTHEQDVLEISLPAPSTGRDSITVVYHGEPRSNGLGSFVQAEHAGVPEVWTLSQPYGAREWWPSRQNLYDKIDSVDVVLEVPMGFTGVSNGLLVDSVEVGGMKRFHWRHRYPIPAYLIALAVTNYTTYHFEVERASLPDLPVENYVYPEALNEQLEKDLALTAPILRLYDSLFLAYPFGAEKYGHAQFSRGGGMEHTTISFMGNFNIELLSHELVHHWFGNYVTCGSWQDLWLNEGFATYFSGVAYEHVLPELWPVWKRGVLDRVTSDPGGTVFAYDTSDVSRLFDSRLTYMKGALVLHTLRWELGDPVFYAGIRSYLQDGSHAFGFSATEDLRFHLEQASGRDLEGFFDRWIYREGFPQYEVEWEQQNGQFSVTVSQQPSHPSVDFFELHVPLYVRGLGGEDTTLVLPHKQLVQSYQVPLPWPVDSVFFDPEIHILSGNNLVYRKRDAERIDVYPVPATSELTIRLGNPRGGLQRVQLIDIQGRLVRSFEGLPSLQYFAFSTEGLLPGSYVLLLDTDRGSEKRWISVID